MLFKKTWPSSMFSYVFSYVTIAMWLSYWVWKRILTSEEFSYGITWCPIYQSPIDGRKYILFICFRVLKQRWYDLHITQTNRMNYVLFNQLNSINEVTYVWLITITDISWTYTVDYLYHVSHRLFSLVRFICWLLGF